MKHAMVANKYQIKNLLILPLPNLINKFLTSQVMSGKILLSLQLFLDNNLRCNTSMVTARHPESGFTLLTVPKISQQAKQWVQNILSMVRNCIWTRNLANFYLPPG